MGEHVVYSRGGKTHQFYSETQIDKKKKKYNLVQLLIFL